MEEISNKALRRAKQSIRLEGFVRSHRLRITNNEIYGKLFIYTDDNSQHPVDVYEPKYDAHDSWKAHVRPEFQTLQNLVNTLDANRNCDVSVRLGRGSHLDVFAKYTDAGDLVERQIIKGKSIETGVSVSPQATFRTEVWVSSIAPLDDNRVVVSTWLPVAINTVVPFNFFAENDVAAYMLKTFKHGDTLTVNGKIVNETRTTERKQKGVGTTWADSVRITTREYLITGCDFAPYDASESFDSKLVAVAIENYRTVLLPKLKAKAGIRKNAPLKASLDLSKEPVRTGRYTGSKRSDPPLVVLPELSI